MSKKLPYTPSSRIRSALRQLFLRSRERASALKKAGYCCEKCGVKQSKAKGKEVKVEVHHIDNGIDNWQEIFDVVRKNLLNEESLEVLCKDCHSKQHKR